MFACNYYQHLVTGIKLQSDCKESREPTIKNFRSALSDGFLIRLHKQITSKRLLMPRALFTVA